MPRKLKNTDTVAPANDEEATTYLVPSEEYNLHLQALESPDPELLSGRIRSLI